MGKRGTTQLAEINQLCDGTFLCQYKKCAGTLSFQHICVPFVLAHSGFVPLVPFLPCDSGFRLRVHLDRSDIRGLEGLGRVGETNWQIGQRGGLGQANGGRTDPVAVEGGHSRQDHVMAGDLRDSLPIAT